MRRNLTNSAMVIELVEMYGGGQKFHRKGALAHQFINQKSGFL